MKLTPLEVSEEMLRAVAPRLIADEPHDGSQTSASLPLKADKDNFHAVPRQEPIPLCCVRGFTECRDRLAQIAVVIDELAGSYGAA